MSSLDFSVSPSDSMLIKDAVMVLFSLSFLSSYSVEMKSSSAEQKGSSGRYELSFTHPTRSICLSFNSSCNVFSEEANFLNLSGFGGDFVKS